MLREHNRKRHLHARRVGHPRQRQRIQHLHRHDYRRAITRAEDRYEELIVEHRKARWRQRGLLTVGAISALINLVRVVGMLHDFGVI